MTEPLQDQVIVVTGGGTGIGSGIAKILAEAGGKVHVIGRRAEPLQALAEQVKSRHPLRIHTLDVGDRAAVDATFARIVKPTDRCRSWSIPRA